MTIDEHKKFVEMQEDISTVKVDVRDIKNALLGDGYISTGLIGELKEQKDVIKKQDERISKLEAMLKKITWLAVGAGAGATFGMKYLFEWIVKITSSN
jgi:hypothetical protein